MIGIYKITNLINNKCYVGQSINIANRWTDHKRLSKKEDDDRYEYPLYRAFRKYGIDNFNFEILEECQEEDLNEKEIYWIKFYNSFEDGYNMTAGGGGTRKYDIQAIVDEYKLNNNIAETARIFSCHPMTVRNIVHSFGLYGDEPEAIKVEQLDPSTLQVIACFSSIREAAASTNLSSAAISKALNDINTNAGGYYWRKQGDTSRKFKPIKKLWKRKVQQLDKNTYQLIAEYDSCADAARAIGKDPKNGGSQIVAVCKGRKPSMYGFIWQYAEN